MMKPEMGEIMKTINVSKLNSLLIVSISMTVFFGCTEQKYALNEKNKLNKTDGLISGSNPLIDPNQLSQIHSQPQQPGTQSLVEQIVPPNCSDLSKLSPYDRPIWIEGQKNLITDTDNFFKLANTTSCDQFKMIRWDAGDGSPIQEGLDSQFLHKYLNPGVYVVKVDITDVSMNQFRIYHTVRVVRTCNSSSCDSYLGDSFLSGNHLGVEGASYSIGVQRTIGLNLTSIVWFVDEDLQDLGLQPQITLQGLSAGDHSVIVSLNNKENRNHSLHLIPKTTKNTDILSASIIGSQYCDLESLQLSSSVLAYAGFESHFELNIPNCLQNYFKSLKWDFGDGSGLNSSGQVNKHTWNIAGSYLMKVQLFATNNANSPYLVIERKITVLNEQPPAIPPVVVTKNCGALKNGEVINLDPLIEVETLVCGLEGEKKNTYSTPLSQICTDGQMVDQKGTKTLVLAGTCEKQSCKVSDNLILKNDSSTIFYSQTQPLGSCSSVSETRICTNGVLSGTSTTVNLNCQSGCGDKYGVNGTKTWETNGTTTSAKSCQFNEEGILNIFNTEIQKVCENGIVSTVESSQRTGQLVQEGNCPTYSWKETGKSECNKDCGGTQMGIFECQDNLGQVMNLEKENRCGVKPTQTYECSSNPSLIITESKSLIEQISSKSCGSNQVGGIFRTKTYTNTTVCTDNKLVTNSNEQEVPWTEENLCVRYNLERCSNDSLTPMQAWGRLEWMKKCKDSVPLLKNFLENNVNADNSPIFELNLALQNFINQLKGPQGKMHLIELAISKLQNIDKGDHETVEGNRNSIISNVMGQLINGKVREVTINPQQIFTEINKIEDFIKFVNGTDEISLLIKDLELVIKDLKVIDLPLQERIRSVISSINAPDSSNKFLLLTKKIKDLINVQALELDQKTKQEINLLVVGFEQLIRSSSLRGANINIGRLTYVTFKQSISKSDCTTCWQIWTAPAPGSKDWNVRSGAPIDQYNKPIDVSKLSCSVPTLLKVEAVCTSSCATADEQLLVELKSMKTKKFIDAFVEKTKHIVTLTPDSSIDEINYKPTLVKQFITEVDDAHIVLLKFKLESGKEVQFTKNHPILTELGTIKTAESFKVGEFFVKQTGAVDKIIEIEEVPIFGKVYNVLNFSNNPKENIISTEGYLNGTSWFQNEGADLLNKDILSKELIEGAL